ncbi:hypothetical protein H5410_027686 [Solanum commersonii]|uniref:Fungal lipase-type domain-containing protein n=1 Tax=Solanum commersonii TaxID=4109 RepID=A0A9J5Z0K0_SOLCO|nr:hypothetical protein H5410_027686 [Solanum commersonii]
MKELKTLVDFYKTKGEQVSLTITGHSLGGALALLNAYELATNFQKLPISVISFASPRVGNISFRDELYQMGGKILRVTLKQDLVPRMLGIWIYTQVGAELKLDVRSSPYLKRGFNFIGINMFETYIHLVNGFVSSSSSFRSNSKRDVALVNKACDMLVD